MNRLRGLALRIREAARTAVLMLVALVTGYNAAKFVEDEKKDAETKDV